VTGVSGVKEINSLTGTLTRVAGPNSTLTACRAMNTTAAVAYVQIFNAAAAADITLGTTIPTWVVTSAASVPSADDGLPSDGIEFPLGMWAASTTLHSGSTGAAQHVRFAIW
jgi:hypothetical protein